MRRQGGGLSGILRKRLRCPRISLCMVRQMRKPFFRCVDPSVCAEFMFPAVSLNPTFREVVDKPFVSELREWVLYKAYHPSIAQGGTK